MLTDSELFLFEQQVLFMVDIGSVTFDFSVHYPLDGARGQNLVLYESSKRLARGIWYCGIFLTLKFKGSGLC